MPRTSSYGSLKSLTYPWYQGYMSAPGLLLWLKPRAWPNSCAATMKISTPETETRYHGNKACSQSMITGLRTLKLESLFKFLFSASFLVFFFTFVKCFCFCFCFCLFFFIAKLMTVKFSYIKRQFKNYFNCLNITLIETKGSDLANITLYFNSSIITYSSKVICFLWVSFIFYLSI